MFLSKVHTVSSDYRATPVNQRLLEQNPPLRKKILSKMKRENAHIVYLQETHLNNTEHEKFKRMGFT